jgi:iron complex transport system substrate-binding protein
MNKKASVIITVIAALLIVGYLLLQGGDVKERSGELTITHELGTTVVDKNPEVVVVFDIGVLDALDALGVEVDSIPTATLPSYLSHYTNNSSIVNAGGIKEPDFEALYELKPDLIIISGRQQDAYEDLNDIAPTLYMAIDNTNYLESFSGNMRLLGQIFDKEDLVEEKLGQIHTKIEELKTLAQGKNVNALITLVNEGQMSAYGEGSRFGIIHKEFGVTAVDQGLEVSTHGQVITFEYLLEKNPHYLFVIDRGHVVTGGSGSAEQTLNNDIVKQMDAYKNDRIIYLSAEIWYIAPGGLRSTIEMVDEVKDALD